jgi:prepilin-type N-terminal cleavage/methylation domain-containing protein
MKHIIEKNGGFTLIEVLLSMVIFSIILIGMMTFFTNGLFFVKENESKTVATQVARNVMNYIEKQDYHVMEGYLTHMLQLESPSSSGSPYYIELDYTSCTENQDLLVKPFPTAQERRELKGVSIFQNQTQCEAVFKSQINNFLFNEKNVQVFVMKYNDLHQMNNLVDLMENDDPVLTLPDSVQKAIMTIRDDITNGSNKQIHSDTINNHLLRVFVVVNWNENREEILLQGVIANESIR